MISWVQECTEKIISRLKHEEYRFQNEISFHNLICILSIRMGQLLKGFICRLGIKGRGLLFCGKKVSFTHGSSIHIGRNCIIGDYSSIDALSKDGVNLGDNVTLGRNVLIKCTGVIRSIGEGIDIGNHVAIGDYSLLYAQGGITIGNDTIIGPKLLLVSENHNYSEKGKLIRLQGENREGIRIGSNCWVGGGVTILDGVTIGNNCVIGAGAVVTNDIEDDCLAVGVPARTIKKINDEVVKI